MVGVGAGVAHLADGLVHGHPPVGEQPDELGDDHGGVGVVNLDDHVVGEGIQGVAPLLQLLENELGAGGHHEVLLVHPQEPSRLVAVVGVEEGGKVVGDVPLVEVDAHPGLGGGLLHVKEVQPVGAAVARAGHRQIVAHRLHVPLAEGYGEGPAGGDEPALLLQPGVGQFSLFVVLELLAEQAVVVVEPHPVAGQSQSGDGVQEAGSQTAQPAVAQGGLGLHGLDGAEIPAQVGQHGLHLVVNAQGQQVVAQQLAREKLRREVIELPPALRRRTRQGHVPGEQQQGLVQLLLPALVGGMAIPLLGQLKQSLFQLHGKNSSPQGYRKRFQFGFWRQYSSPAPSRQIFFGEILHNFTKV